MLEARTLPPFPAPEVLVDEAQDGAVVLRNALAPPPYAGAMFTRLAHWARQAPDRCFLSEPTAGGARRTVSYGEAEGLRLALARRLLGRGLTPDRPLLIVGANGLGHAMIQLAATSVGIPVAVVSPAYVAPSAAPWGRFSDIVADLRPWLVLADDVAAVRAILQTQGANAVEVQALGDLTWLPADGEASEADVAAASAAVGPDTVAKLLYTSGSTGKPKAVINTQGMMVSNMQALALVWPFLRHAPPVLVDWLPWNHTFGGNCCFNLTLYFGGTLHIDEGRPAPAMIDRTLDAIAELRPTVYFNVPLGYEALLPRLEADQAFAARFFGDLTFLFNAGAALPPASRTRLVAAALAATGREPLILGGWGATETAPFSTVLYFRTDEASNIGVPLPGVDLKLLPQGARAELRVRGPNVMPGYWNDAAAAAAAFDAEGFYRIGDAGRLADEGAPEAGVLFEGRIAENFKLSSGTWVNVGALRLAVLDACDGLVADAVVAGDGRDEIGLLLFLNPRACHEAFHPVADAAGAYDAFVENSEVTARLTGLLRAHNERQAGSSTRVACFIVADAPPSAEGGEITEKGSVNQRRVLERRPGLVARLHAAGHRL